MNDQLEYITPELLELGSIEELTGWGHVFFTFMDPWTDWDYL